MTALRIVAFAFGAVLVYSLYLPSSCPPERFVEQVRREHDLNAAFWGADHAGQILSRALSLYGQRDELAPAAFASTPGAPITAANAAVTQQMADVVQRLFHNRYAQGFDAVRGKIHRQHRADGQHVAAGGGQHIMNLSR